MRPKHAVFLVLGAAIAMPVLGQSRPDPADPAIQVPPATYRSAFADYRPLDEAPVGDWRAANDEVGRIGGWRAYAREAQAPDKPTAVPAPASAAPPTAAPPAAVPAPASGGHGQHGMHGGKQ
ncbi:MAG: hypothetical protein ABI630_11080 [Betaproteobacteria bacterium]